jgi:hypothetical protein
MARVSPVEYDTNNRSVFPFLSLKSAWGIDEPIWLTLIDKVPRELPANWVSRAAGIVRVPAFAGAEQLMLMPPLRLAVNTDPAGKLAPFQVTVWSWARLRETGAPELSWNGAGRLNANEDAGRSAPPLVVHVHFPAPITGAGTLLKGPSVAAGKLVGE